MTSVLPRLNLSKASITQWTQSKITPLLSDVIMSFLVSFQSECTRRSYLNDLRDFMNFLSSSNTNTENIELITQINEELILLWQKHLNTTTEKKLSQITIRRKLNALASLLEFSHKRQLIAENPMRFIKRPKVKAESKTNAFTEDEVLKILSLLKEKNPTYPSLSYTIILTLFSVGMRVNELCSLKIQDIEFTQDFTRLHMLAKGKEEHAPLIHPKTAAVLKEYLQKIRKNAKPTDYVFCSAQKGRPEGKLSQVAVYKMITKAAQAVGIEKKVSPHSCRATLATLLYKQGVPLVQIQRLLNHKDVTTTTVYIKKADELAEAAATQIEFS